MITGRVRKSGAIRGAPPDINEVHCKTWLGGLLRQYYRKATRN